MDRKTSKAQSTEFMGRQLDKRKLLSKKEVLEYLLAGIGDDAALAYIRQNYERRFGDNMTWLYPISAGNAAGGMILPVKEGFLWLPYREMEKECGEIFDLKSAYILTKEELEGMLACFQNYAAQLCEALSKAASIAQNTEEGTKCY